MASRAQGNDRSDDSSTFVNDNAKKLEEIYKKDPLAPASAASSAAGAEKDSGVVESSLIRWIIAVTVSSAALLEVIDTSIVNVALNQIQGNLGATLAEAGWVVTGYSVANAIMIPLTAWLGDRFGKKAYFVFSLIGFTISSMMCGFAPNLTTLVVSRIIQGLCGGGLLAKAQAILFETFPKEEQAAAQGLFGICVMVGPVVGPTLGGYLTDYFNWRWIFFVNLPFGILATILASMYLPKTPVKKTATIDWWGIILLVACIGSLQTVLEEGQQDDWFSSQYITALVVVALLGGILFIWRELVCRDPAVNLKILRYKSLAAGSCYSLCLGMCLYGATFAVPIFAQNILHYTPTQTGLLMLPGAIASALCMPLFAKLAGKVDARILIASGALLSVFSMWQLSTMNPNTSADSMFWPLVWRGIASIFMFMPLSTATLGSLPKEYIGAGSGFFSLTRQMGGSIGIAALTTLLSQRETYHRSVLVEQINNYNPIFNDMTHKFGAILMQHGADRAGGYMGAMGMVNGIVETQSAVLAFADMFWIVGFTFVISMPLLLFLSSGKNARASAGH
ncbi:MAG: DHA2 family efflux MFS transporter permease subunit [Cyanobacteria bacterium REEB67]|nr:DHA2 family efflux MFS transporter permease subunit [Cyanobacteria bacterium REEB67]